MSWTIGKFQFCFSRVAPPPEPVKMHYCVDHQGDGSHYSSKNCLVCTLRWLLPPLKKGT